MEFDYIIGNPPYQDTSSKSGAVKLWKKISDKMLQRTKQLMFITPRANNWMNQKKNNKHNFVLVSYTANNYFPEVGVDVMYWYLKTNETQQDVRVISSDKSERYDKLKYAFENTERDFRVFQINVFKLPTKERLLERTKGKTWFYDKNRKGLFIQLSKAFKIYYSIDDVKINLSTSVETTNLSEEEIQNIHDFLNDDLFQKICEVYKRTNNTGYNIFLEFVPKEAKTGITPKEYYRKYGLTDELIKYITFFRKTPKKG